MRLGKSGRYCLGDLMGGGGRISLGLWEYKKWRFKMGSLREREDELFGGWKVKRPNRFAKDGAG